MPLLRRVRVAAVLTAVIAATCALPAVADPADDVCVDGGKTLRYIVLFDRGTPPEAAQSEMTRSCGPDLNGWPSRPAR